MVIGRATGAAEDAVKIDVLESCQSEAHEGTREDEPEDKVVAFFEADGMVGSAHSAYERVIRCFVRFCHVDQQVRQDGAFRTLISQVRMDRGERSVPVVISKPAIWASLPLLYSVSLVAFVVAARSVSCFGLPSRCALVILVLGFGVDTSHLTPLPSMFSRALPSSSRYFKRETATILQVQTAAANRWPAHNASQCGLAYAE